MKEDDLNAGVQIILARMKSHPEEFFDDGGSWRWIFKDTLREVMTETEKVAIHEQLKLVRRMEITAKAAATILKVDEQREEEQKEQYRQAISQLEKASPTEKRLILNAAQAQMLKRMNK